VPCACFLRDSRKVVAFSLLLVLEFVAGRSGAVGGEERKVEGSEWSGEGGVRREGRRGNTSERESV